MLHQDYPNIEYIVIHDGSLDGSRNILRKYESHLAYWVSQSDTGQSNAINRGFRKDSGDIFAWLNSDDLLIPSAARIAAHYLMRYPDVSLVYGDTIHIDSKGNIMGINRCPSYNRKMLGRNFTLPQETAFFRRTIYETVGGLDESLHFAMTFDLWSKMSKITAMPHIPLIMGYCRSHNKAKSVLVHRVDKSESAKDGEGHEKVYHRHFGAALPSAVEMKCYRLLRRLNLLIEQRSDKYRQEIVNIRSLICE